MTWSKFAREGKDLYAVFITHRVDQTNWKPQMHYVHAECQVQAEAHFKVKYPNRAQTQIVAAGPVIGAKVNDKQGMKLII